MKIRFTRTAQGGCDVDPIAVAAGSTVRPDDDRLAGTIEVDEVYIGGEKPGKRGRSAARKALVLAGAQADGPQIGRIRLVRVANASQSVLTPTGRGIIEPKA